MIEEPLTEKTVIELCKNVEEKLNRLELFEDVLKRPPYSTMYCIRMPDKSVLKLHSSKDYINLSLMSTIIISEDALHITREEIREVQYIKYYFSHPISSIESSEAAGRVFSLYQECGSLFTSFDNEEVINGKIRNEKRKKIIDAHFKETLDELREY